MRGRIAAIFTFLLALALFLFLASVVIPGHALADPGNRFLVGGAGYPLCDTTAISTDSDCWSLTSGGAGGASVPGASDTAFVDSNTAPIGFFSGGIMVVDRWIMTGFAGEVTFDGGDLIAHTEFAVSSSSPAFGRFNLGAGRTLASKSIAVSMDGQFQTLSTGVFAFKFAFSVTGGNGEFGFLGFTQYDDTSGTVAWGWGFPAFGGCTGTIVIAFDGMPSGNDYRLLRNSVVVSNDTDLDSSMQFNYDPGPGCGTDSLLAEPATPPICTTGAAVFVQLAPLIVAVAVFTAVALFFLAFKDGDGADPVNRFVPAIVSAVILFSILAALWPLMTVC